MHNLYDTNFTMNWLISNLLFINKGVTKMNRRTLLAISIFFIMVITNFSTLEAEEQKPSELNIIWHSGVLGDLLNEMGKEYTKQTGVVINVDLVPWAKWHDTIAADFASKEGKYDLVIFDSQSMSEFASRGNILLLNPYLEKSNTLRIKDYDPRSIVEYAEYPEGSSKFYALPINQDAMGLVYRRDLLESPEEKANFKARYGYDLAVPKTYGQLKDIAEFFTRPEKNLYGIALYGSRDYDAVTSAFNNVLWSFGGDLWNPETKKAEGVINSQASVAALEYFKKLFDYAPPGATNWYYDEVNNAINGGNVAMGINWYYFFNTYVDPKVNKMADKMGFAPLPGEKDINGNFHQYNSVGGQGISISKYSNNVDEAWKFLEWLMSNPRQWEWVRGGGQTGRVDILNSPDYENATPYNSIFPISMSRVKDYWHLVEYPQLLDMYQKNINLAITGGMSPKEALDNVAKEQQALLDKTSEYGILDIDSIARSLPPDSDSMVTDKRLIDRPDAGVRVFRVNREVPRHYHTKSDEHLYVISGKARFVIAEDEPRVVSAGDLIFFKKGTYHGVIEILERPLIVLSFDVPQRDPKDVVFEKATTQKLLETK